MIIFPAVDILNGWCVRLHKGEYDAVTVYAKDPSEVAKAWEADGADWLHVVDIDGAREGSPVNLEAVEKIIDRVSIPVQFGGGARTPADLKRLSEIGVARIVLGTALVTDRDFARQAISKYADGLVAGIDGRESKVAVSGWREDTDVDVAELAAELEALGIKRVIYTDINVDGTRSGPNVAAVRYLSGSVGIPVIASGGVSSIDDIVEIKNVSPPVEGLIIGSALYEKVFGLPEALEAARG